jgi:hypothetical protein
MPDLKAIKGKGFVTAKVKWKSYQGDKEDRHRVSLIHGRGGRGKIPSIQCGGQTGTPM